MLFPLSGAVSVTVTTQEEGPGFESTNQLGPFLGGVCMFSLHRFSLTSSQSPKTCAIGDYRCASKLVVGVKVSVNVYLSPC